MKKGSTVLVLLISVILALIVSFSGDLTTGAVNIVSIESTEETTPFAGVVKDTSVTLSSICSDTDNTCVTVSEEKSDLVDTYSSKETEVNGYIYIGDSRFVGMNSVCSIDSEGNTFVIAEISQGYSWLVSSAISEIDSIISSNKNITKWNIVIGLGINDLGNISSYLEEYQRLADNYTLFVVSVNPIEYHNYITDSDITKFNNELKTLDNIVYIDTYSDLISKGFSTQDGIHYTNSTYENIFSYIKMSITS